MNQISQTSNNTTLDPFDLSELVEFDPQPPTDRKIEYNFDPLAFALAAENQNYQKYQVHLLLESRDPKDFLSLAEIKNYESISNNIQKYYRNKLLVRKLKGLHFSNFMKNLEQILDNPRKIKQSQIKIILSLNNFYKEDKATEELFKNYKSLEEESINHQLDDVFSFVKIVERFSKKKNSNRYYFANKNKNLLMIESIRESNEDRLMNYLSRQPTILIQGNCMITSQPVKNDFLIYSKGNYNFYNAER
jgi:hypothetical protein